MFLMYWPIWTAAASAFCCCSWMELARCSPYMNQASSAPLAIKAIATTTINSATYLRKRFGRHHAFRRRGAAAVRAGKATVGRPSDEATDVTERQPASEGGQL